MNVRFFLTFLLCLWITSPVFGRTDERRWCGTRGPDLTRFLLKEYEHRERQRDYQQRLALAAIKSEAQDIGDIAVIKANAKTLPPVNPFDLVGKKIIFSRNKTAGGFNTRVVNGAVSGNQGNPITLQDDDSKKVEFTSGFSFPYYGTTYTSVFINTDGNLTFKSGDNASTARDIFRALTGPPRIAPFFQDLNPVTGGTVKVLQTSSRFTVTWDQVSEYLENGRNFNTFQVSLLKNGNIEFVYGSRIDTRAAIVGISPGNAKIAQLRLVNWSSAGNLTAVETPIMERFATRQEVDFSALINEFLRTHTDIYDFVVIFSDFPVNLGNNAFAFFAHTFNNIRGIGLENMNFQKPFGTTKLQGFLAMGFLGKYPNDPNQEFLFENSTIEVMGQENGHRWLAFPLATVNGVRSNMLLGRDNDHWNFYMDTDASCMEGNDIRDNGDGTFLTVGANETFSKLDRYIMGFLPPGAVPPFFVVQGNSDTGRPPETGVAFRGTRVNVTVQNIISAEGPRVPGTASSQKKFREAFILLTKKTTPAQADIAKLDRIRTLWQAFFKKETGNKGSIDTTLP